MPNGGSDCCGTCWFNTQNQGPGGSVHSDRTIPARCTIRNLALANPFYTYCANHPHRCPDLDPVPVGPAFLADSTGARQLWHSSPDTEQVREHLLGLLAAMKEEPASEYPIGAYRDEVVVWQLGEFRDARAIPELERLATFNPESAESGPYGRTRHGLVALAREALAKIQGPAA